MSNLDRLTLSNVSRGSKTLLVHAAAAWAITCYAFRLLWSYCTLAVSLRIRHLTTTPRGAETHSILVTDVPGVEAGSFARRLDETVFRLLPGPVKTFLKRAVTTAFDVVEKGVAATAGRVADAVIVGDADAINPRASLAGGVRGAWRRSEVGGGGGSGSRRGGGGTEKEEEVKGGVDAADAAAGPSAAAAAAAAGPSASSSSPSPASRAPPPPLAASERAAPPERFFDVIDLDAGREEEAARMREAAAVSAEALAAAERRARGEGSSSTAPASVPADDAGGSCGDSDDDDDDDLSSLPTALRLLSFSPQTLLRSRGGGRSSSPAAAGSNSAAPRENAPGSAIAARRLFGTTATAAASPSNPTAPAAAPAPPLSQQQQLQHDVVAAAATAAAAAAPAAALLSQQQPRGYLATLPKGPPPAANRPPVDASAYVAKTEIAAWTKAAAFLAEDPVRNTPHALVEREFRELFPGQVHSVSVVTRSRRLTAAHEEYALRFRALSVRILGLSLFFLRGKEEKERERKEWRREKLTFLFFKKKNIIIKKQDLCDDYTSKLRRHVEVRRNRVSVLPAKYGEWGRAMYAPREPRRATGSGGPLQSEEAGDLRGRVAAAESPDASAPQNKKGNSSSSSSSALKTIRVDALSFNVARLTELARVITSLQAEGAKNIAAAAGGGVGLNSAQTVLRPEPAAFVTFKTRRSAVLAAAALLHHDASAWHAQPAPGPREVLWDNLSLRAWERSLRAVFSWTALITFSLAFLSPVAAIQTFLELPALANVRGLQTFITFPVVQSVVQCILPPLFLNGALLPVPWLIGRLSSLKGAPSRSAVDFAVVQQYFAFLVITVFFGSFAFGSVLNQLTMWARHPAQALTILGTAAPLTSLFFLNYVQFNALAAAPFALLRIFPLVLFALKSRAASTERAKARLWQDQFATFGPLLPRHSLVGLVGIVFAPINPLVPLMCTVYFLMASITEKYNMLYVRRERYQSGGLLWPRGADQVMVSLVVGQGVLAFLLFVKGAPWAGGVVLPLVPMTLLFRYAATQLVDRPFSVLSLRAAVDLDAADAADAAAEAAELGFVAESSGGGAGGGSSSSTWPSRSPAAFPAAASSSSVSQPVAVVTAPAAASTLYRQPAMEFDAGAHDSLLAEARHIDGVLRDEEALRRELADYNRFGLHFSASNQQQQQGQQQQQQQGGGGNTPRLLGAAQGVWRPRRQKPSGVDDV